MRVKLLVLGLIGSLFFISPVAVNADQAWVGDPGANWIPPDDAERGIHVQWFQDSWQGDASSSLIDDVLRASKFEDPTCRSLQDSRCTSQNLGFNALLPFCEQISDFYCLEDFGLISGTGEKISAKHSRNYPAKAQNEFTGTPSLRVPTGSTGSLFNLPEALHQGGDLYYVSVLVGGSAHKKSPANLGDLTIKIFPVALENDPRIGALAQGAESGWAPCPEECAGEQKGVWRNQGACLTQKGFCVVYSGQESTFAKRYSFPAGKKYYVKVRTPNLPSGWMHGRISQPDISITGIDGNYKIMVSAFPVAVPVVYKTYKYSQMPQALKDQYDIATGDYKPQVATYSQEIIKQTIEGGCGRTKCTPDPLTRNKMVQPGPSDPFGMDQLKLWLPFVEDKATAVFGTWTLRTLNSGEASGALPCFTDGSKGVTGIVTTNATQYLAGPPKFNRSEQALEYKVSAPHLTPQGTTFFGSYDLLMRSDVARCVYSFSNAPIKGTISVTGSDGEQKIATESVKEANGWVSLSANGFTYSAPTISVKLSQDKIEAPKPTSTGVEAKPSNEAAKPQIAAKKKSITCTNGKLTKKVSAINPKCPAGFKKK